MCKGFVRIPRRLFETKWWNEKRVYSAFDALVDLYNSADRKDTVVTSLRALADRWLWNQVKTLRFLGKLQKEGYITAETTSKCTTIRIIDFGAKCNTSVTPSVTLQDKKCNTETSADNDVSDGQCNTKTVTGVTPTVTQSVTDNIYRYIDNNIPPISPKREREKHSKFVKPTVEDIQAYITEKGYDLNAQQIFDHYEMVGWVYGRGHNPIKDWKAAVRTWNRNSDKAQKLPIGFNLRDNSPNKYDNDIPGW